jgi:membrane protein DedA with SNARE-associated domain
VNAIVSFLFSLLRYLGAFGLVIVGVLDSSFLFLPLGNDLLVLVMSASAPGKLPYYAAMATLGSALGCLFIDWISRKGGEDGLKKVLPQKRIEYVKKKVSERAGYAVAVASLMPPPFPFTPFVAGAAAFRYPRKKLFSILVATRLLRFTIVGLLGIFFGRRILRIANEPWVRYTILALVVISVVGSVISVVGWVKRSRAAASK